MTIEEPLLHAWLDESEPDRATYVLAASIGDVAQVEGTRDVMQRLLLKGERKVHWHAERTTRRLRIVEALAAAPLQHLVVVREGAGREKPDRR